MRNILTAAAVFVCAVSFAQNINPTVEVTNTYQGNPSEVHKPQAGMAIPDSLMRFDMDFDYEVFQKPYQGAYNFKPYELDMKPEKDAYRGRKLYLKAGAGYSLHPQLDFVLSPEQNGPFQMSVYARHRSYFGQYNRMALGNGPDIKIDRVRGKGFFGHDAATSAGFEGRYNWQGSILSFGVGYSGLMAGDTLFNRSYNAADFNIRFRTNKDEDKYFFYDVALKGRFGSDYRYKPKKSSGYHWSFAPYSSSWATSVENNVNEGLFSLVGDVGPVLSASSMALVGFEAETASYRKLFSNNAGRIALVPKYVLRTGNWDFLLGVRLEKLITGSEDQEGWPFMPSYQYKGRMVFPEVKVTYNVADKVSLYASATGGNTVNTYSSLLSRQHFLNPVLCTGNLLDNTVEAINAKAGVRGTIGSRFQFELDGGAAVYENGLLDHGICGYRFDVDASAMPSTAESVQGLTVLPSVAYADYSLLYADFLFDYNSGRTRVDGGIHLKRAALRQELDFGFLPPAVTYNLRAERDITSRIYAGLTVQGASSRKGMIRSVTWQDLEVKIPGYFDLGILGGYRLNRKLGAWLESGNLLCQSIQRNPFYSEKGLWITAGITLSL